MIVPSDEVILLRRKYIQLQDELVSLKEKMQKLCDHDLVVASNSSSDFRMCEICGKESLTLGDRNKRITQHSFDNLRRRLEDINFVTSYERPVKDVIE